MKQIKLRADFLNEKNQIRNYTLEKWLYKKFNHKFFSLLSYCKKSIF